MNTTNFHNPLVAPAVSRTTFFTELLAESSPRPQAEPPLDEVLSENPSALPLPTVARPQPITTGFPA